MPRLSRMSQSFDIAKTFVHLRDGGSVERVNLTPSFWKATEQRDGLVVGAFDFASPRDLHSSMQEIHPDADELLLLVSGALDVVLVDGDAGRRIALTTNRAAIVPRGMWHH